MNSLPFRISGLVAVAFAFSACSIGPETNPTFRATSPAGPANVIEKTPATQYLYVYDVGIPGSVPGAFARYSLPDLKVQETSPADGVASGVGFNAKGQPFFVDEATGASGFALYLLPIGHGKVAAKQQFYGIPCHADSLSIGPNGDAYVDQYCAADALEYTPGKKENGPKKPRATFKGGNLGKSGITDATYVAVDPNGGLYVGDNRGGITYFAPGSKKGSVAYKTGYGGLVNQIIVDKNGDVWSVHGPDPTAIYFKDEKSCVLDKNGTVVRNEFGEHFSKGKLVGYLYTATSDSSLFSDNGVSIAIDTKGRIYTGNQNNGIPGVVLDFDPGNACPNDSLSFALDGGANPQLAVDAGGTYYVTDTHDNTIAAYDKGSTKLLKKITQPSGLTAITYTAINP